MAEHIGRLRGLGIEARIEGATLEYRMQKLERQAKAKGIKDHIWTFVIMHRLSEDAARGVKAGELHFDVESIVMAGGPICYRCEAPEYTAEPCPGYREIVRAD